VCVCVWCVCVCVWGCVCGGVCVCVFTYTCKGYFEKEFGETKEQKEGVSIP